MKEKTPFVDLDAASCLGCSACANICPRQCIKMEPDDHGFLVPRVDFKRCVNCGMCRAICPVLSERQVNNRITPLVYAAYSLDANTRYQSTSGGIFSEIAGWVISNGGYVAGAIYDEDLQVSHFITNDANDIQRLRQSKYVQSDKKRVYSQIQELLSKGVKVLFTGTPCEAAGLLFFLQKKPDGLLLVDFICAGVNSPLVYKEYLRMLSSRYRSPVSRIWFKYKKYGWEQFVTRVDFQNGKIYIGDRHQDLYMRGYLFKSLYLRPCCYHCRYNGFPRSSDLTLGDFWGIGNHFPNIDRTNGISAILSNTECGDAMLRAIQGKLFMQECAMVDLMAENPRLHSSAQKAREQDAFYLDMKRLGFERAVKLHTKEKLSFRLRRVCKRYLKRTTLLFSRRCWRKDVK